jgi:hypothetical protein
MFFRREKPKVPTFDERMDALRQMGFSVENQGGRTQVSRKGCAAMVEAHGTEVATTVKPGVLVGQEIGHLTHGGYQMFFRTSSGRVVPAQAHQLKELHNFAEDLREALDEKSLYNLSLGTTCDAHLYDRVEDRDAGVPTPAWKK